MTTHSNDQVRQALALAEQLDAFVAVDGGDLALVEQAAQLLRALAQAPQAVPLSADQTMFLLNQSAGQHWCDEAHIQRFRAAIEAAHGITGQASDPSAEGLGASPSGTGSGLGASPVGDRAVGPSDPSPSVSAVPASIPGAMHASAPPGKQCADCFMDGEPCPACYSAAWKRRHPNVFQL